MQHLIRIARSHKQLITTAAHYDNSKQTNWSGSGSVQELPQHRAAEQLLATVGLARAKTDPDLLMLMHVMSDIIGPPVRLERTSHIAKEDLLPMME